MDTAEFQAGLKRNGFNDVETKLQPADLFVPAHSHDFDVRALVLAGELTLGVNGETRTFRGGEVFDMPAGREHTEKYGPKGYSYVVGRQRGTT